MQIHLKNETIDLRRRWAWQPIFKIKLICTGCTETRISGVSKMIDRQTVGLCSIDSASDIYHIYTLWSLPYSLYYILLHKVCIHFFDHLQW